MEGTAGRSSYLTIAADGEAEIEIKRSRFRCRLSRVTSEAAARSVIADARTTHWDARHHCSAFRIGPMAEVQRSNDDGEPSGTAGAPMLEVLARRDVSDVVAVVTRWFGGTLLGSGGLVRAYSDAVNAAVDAVGLRERRLMRRLTIHAAHATAARLESTVRDAGVAVEQVEYDASGAALVVLVPDGDVEPTVAEIDGWTSGRADVTRGDPVWADDRLQP